MFLLIKAPEVSVLTYVNNSSQVSEFHSVNNTLHQENEIQEQSQRKLDQSVF